MLKKIGKLDYETKKELDSYLNDIFSWLDKGKQEKAKKKLMELSNTQNYFIREYVGKGLANYHELSKIEPIAEEMIKHRMYGIRATALFFFYEIYKDDFDKILNLLEETYDVIRWEAESMIKELWKHYPDKMKEKMKKWVDSDDPQKQYLSIYGLENITKTDAETVIYFVGKLIHKEDVELHKKITQILTQALRENPIVVYPHLHHWIALGEEKVITTIWIVMKKIANTIFNKRTNISNNELAILTQQTITDWSNDENEYVAEMGSRLYGIMKKRLGSSRKW